MKAFIFLLLAIVPPIVCGEVFVWSAPAGGVASAKSNWRTNGLVPDRLPGVSDDILLDASGTGPVVWNAGQDTGDGVLSATVGSWAQTAEFAGEVLFSNLTFTSFSTTFTNFSILGSCVISNGIWTHQEHPKNVVWSNRYLLKVKVEGNFELGPGARINADGKGWWSDYRTNYYRVDQFGTLGGTRGWTLRFDPPPLFKAAGAIKGPVEPGRGGSWGAETGCQAAVRYGLMWVGQQLLTALSAQRPFTQTAPTVRAAVYSSRPDG